MFIMCLKNWLTILDLAGILKLTRLLALTMFGRNIARYILTQPTYFVFLHFLFCATSLTCGVTYFAGES